MSTDTQDTSPFQKVGTIDWPPEETPPVIHQYPLAQGGTISWTPDYIRYKPEDGFSVTAPITPFMSLAERLAALIEEIDSGKQFLKENSLNQAIRQLSEITNDKLAVFIRQMREKHPEWYSEPRYVAAVAEELSIRQIL